MSAPTQDEVAKARAWAYPGVTLVYEVGWRAEKHIRVLLAALDAAERERDTLAREACRAFGADPIPTVERALDCIRSMWVAASSDSARRRAERAEAERDELAALVPALRESLATAHERAGRMERERDEARAKAGGGA